MAETDSIQAAYDSLEVMADPHKSFNRAVLNFQLEHMSVSTQEAKRIVIDAIHGVALTENQERDQEAGVQHAS